MRIEIKINRKEANKYDLMIKNYGNSDHKPDSLDRELESFTKLLPRKSVSKCNPINHKEIIRSPLDYKITSTKKKLVLETEMIQVAAKVCSLLSHREIGFKIKIHKKLSFAIQNEDLVEIYEKDAPIKLITKCDYMDEEDNDDDYYDDCECLIPPMKNSDNYYNMNNFTFCFNSSFFKSNIVTNEMCCDAIKKCEIHYECSTKKISKSLKKDDISSIKFTDHGLQEILKWLDKHRDILNIPYEKLELKLATLNLIECD